MQIFFKQNLAMLAVPKTGTTALEAALRGKADILFKGRRKHMSAAAKMAGWVFFVSTSHLRSRVVPR